MLFSLCDAHVTPFLLQVLSQNHLPSAEGFAFAACLPKDAGVEIPINSDSDYLSALKVSSRMT